MLKRYASPGALLLVWVGTETPGLRHSAPQRQSSKPAAKPTAPRLAEGAIRVLDDRSVRRPLPPTKRHRQPGSLGALR